MFKSNIGPVKNFCGSDGGFPAAHDRPKSLSLPQNGQKSRFLDKIRPGEWGLIFACNFSFQNLNYSVLWAQKILRDVPAASGHIWEA